MARRFRPNLINKAPRAKAEVPMEEALKAREANLLGKNGVSHGQDRYLARAHAGDLVIPLDELSPETRIRLEEKIGGFEGRIVGQGGELQLSAQHTNGAGVAEDEDVNALLSLVARNLHREEHGKGLSRFEKYTRIYLNDKNTKQIFIYKKDREIVGAIWARAIEPPLESNLYVLCEFLFVDADIEADMITDNLLKAAEIWAQTIDATRILIEERFLHLIPENANKSLGFRASSSFLQKQL